MSDIIGYYGENPQNRIQLQSLLAKHGKDWQSIQVGGFGVAAPIAVQLADGVIAGLVGRVLPLASEANQTTSPMLEALAQTGIATLAESDGQWAIAMFEPHSRRLTLAHDHFGAYQLYYAQSGNTLWFSSSFRLLLQVPEVAQKRELDLAALQAYLAFSYVPAPLTLLKPIRAVPPGQTLIISDDGKMTYYEQSSLLTKSEAVPLDEQRWVEHLQAELAEVVTRRLPGEKIALSLSGGLDSSVVATILARHEMPVQAFYLDFGAPFDEEKPYAQAVAHKLGLPLQMVAVQPRKGEGERLLREVVATMPQPYGDPVMLPLYLGCKTAAAQGYHFLFNGEGGDQLFAGWANKAMLAAEVYGTPEHDRIEAYLQTFHHFYGLEAVLYSEKLKQATVNLRPAVAQYLEEARLPNLFDRLRWTNIWMKGSGNIIPRMAALARAHGLEMQAPLFDVRLARFALTIPSDLLLNGSTEKYLLKQAFEGLLPNEIINRPKRGMGVPATEWCLQPFHSEIKKWLGNAVKRRGLFQKEYVTMLLKGQDISSEIRRRRLGEKLWQLAILELWLQTFLD